MPRYLVTPVSVPPVSSFSTCSASRNALSRLSGGRSGLDTAQGARQVSFMAPMPLQAPPFSEQDHQHLADWLSRRSTGITDIVELEGFLTAIVIGPNTLSPTSWLQKVWGGKQPKFKDLDDLNRFVALVMGYYNDIVAWFEQDPERFEPTFYESKVEGKRILVVDEWCFGFLKGMRPDAAA